MIGRPSSQASDSDSDLPDYEDDDTDDYDSDDSETLYHGDDDGYGDVYRPRYRPGWSESELRNLLWEATDQEDIPEDIRAALIEMADQSDPEDEDSHVRVRQDWFDRCNILDDRCPLSLGHPMNPVDNESDDEEDGHPMQHWQARRRPDPEDDSDSGADVHPIPPDFLFLG